MILRWLLYCFTIAALGLWFSWTHPQSPWLFVALPYGILATIAFLTLSLLWIADYCDLGGSTHD